MKGIAIFAAFKMIPRLLVVLYAIVILFSSLSIAIRENDANAFFIDGIGNIVAGSDKSLSDTTVEMVTSKSLAERNWLGFVTILGDLLVFYYILKIIYLAMSKSFEMASPAISFLWSFAILFLLQTIYFTALSGTLHIGFTGLFKLLLNMDAWLYPIADWVVIAGDISIRSPII